MKDAYRQADIARYLSISTSSASKVFRLIDEGSVKEYYKYNWEEISGGAK